MRKLIVLVLLALTAPVQASFVLGGVTDEPPVDWGFEYSPLEEGPQQLGADFYEHGGPAIVYVCDEDDDCYEIGVGFVPIDDDE